MEILKINELPPSTTEESILYEEYNDPREAFYNWCIFKINELLSNHSATYLKNNSIEYDLYKNVPRGFEIFIPAVEIKLIDSLINLGYSIKKYKSTVPSQLGPRNYLKIIISLK